MPATIRVVDGRTVIRVGENTVEAGRQAARATTEADRAEAASALSQLAAEQAADLVLPENRFVAADITTAVANGEAATAVGTYFVAAGVAEGEAQTRQRTSGGSTLIYAVMTKAQVESDLATKANIADLASTAKGEGSADIGTEFGTVESRLYRAHNYGSKVNPAKIVTVGGKNVVLSNNRKPKLIILLGQSNAEGRATSFDANQSGDITGTRPSVQIWTGSAFEDLFVPNLSSVTGNNDAQPGRHGIELALANFVEAEAIQTTTTETTVHMVKVTEGGTFMGQWLATEDIIAWDGVNPNNPDDDGDLSLATPGPGVLDSEAWTKVQAAAAEMDVLYGAGNWEPVLVMIQGEANGGSPTQFPRFKRQRKTFNARWRTRLGSTLRIIQPHILARNAEYIAVNTLLNEIDYEDDWSYVISDVAYLPTNDDIHLNYFGMVQLGRRVANEIFNPTTKIINQPKVYHREIAGSATLPLIDTDEVVYLTGTTTIDRAPLNAYWEGRKLTFLRTEAGGGISLRNESGSTSTHTLFKWLTGATVAMSSTGIQRREVIAKDGYFQEVPVVNRVAPIADLNQTISATPTQAEVQAISDKMDALLFALRTSGYLQS